MTQSISNRFILALCSISMIATAGNATNGQEKTEPLTVAEFKKLHKSLHPEKEVWKTIPWRLNLIDAQNAAAKQKKMMVIWAMDGHPLGCT